MPPSSSHSNARRQRLFRYDLERVSITRDLFVLRIGKRSDRRVYVLNLHPFNARVSPDRT